MAKLKCTVFSKVVLLLFFLWVLTKFGIITHLDIPSSMVNKSNCCFKNTAIIFNPKQNIDLEYNATSLYELSSVVTFPNLGVRPAHGVMICEDGEPHDGTYCSVRSCNFLGCDCEAPCFTGDKDISAVEMFHRKYGHLVYIVEVVTMP